MSYAYEKLLIFLPAILIPVYASSNLAFHVMYSEYKLNNAGQETTVRTGHGATDWFQTGKGVLHGNILSLCLFNLYAEYIMRNAGLDEAQAGIKTGLKLNIQKTKIMASGPITSWQVDGETLETVGDFILGAPEITTDGDYSHEIKRCLLLGRKVMTNSDSILKRRDITLPTNVCLVKAMVFTVVMYGCESWTIKKAEC